MWESKATVQRATDTTLRQILANISEACYTEMDLGPGVSTLRVALRMSYNNIVELVVEQFNEKMSRGFFDPSFCKEFCCSLC